MQACDSLSHTHFSMSKKIHRMIHRHNQFTIDLAKLNSRVIHLHTICSAFTPVVSSRVGGSISPRTKYSPFPAYPKISCVSSFSSIANTSSHLATDYLKNRVQLELCENDYSTYVTTKLNENNDSIDCGNSEYILIYSPLKYVQLLLTNTPRSSEKQ